MSCMIGMSLSNVYPVSSTNSLRAFTSRFPSVSRSHTTQERTIFSGHTRYSSTRISVLFVVSPRMPTQPGWPDFPQTRNDSLFPFQNSKTRSIHWRYPLSTIIFSEIFFMAYFLRNIFRIHSVESVDRVYPSVGTIAFRSGRSFPSEEKTRIIRKCVVIIIPSFLCHETSHFFSASTRVFRAFRDSISSMRCSNEEIWSSVLPMPTQILTDKKDPQKRWYFLGVRYWRVHNRWIPRWIRRFHPSFPPWQNTFIAFSPLTFRHESSLEKEN